MNNKAECIMNNLCKWLTSRLIIPQRKIYYTIRRGKRKHCCKILIVGGGPGGCSVAARFSKILYKHEVIVVEPKDIHIYKPCFPLIAAGVKSLRQAVKPTLQVLPENVIWLKDSVEHFCPNTNSVVLRNGDTVVYEFMVLALGVKIDYDEVCGLENALKNYEDVCTIYSPAYVEKTHQCLQNFVCGTALFTTPSSPISCYAASQQICYIAEDYFKKNKKLESTKIIFVTAQNMLFPVKLYEDALHKVMDKKNVDVRFCMDLIEVQPECRKAVFACLDKPGNKICLKYSLLHVTPPMSPPYALKGCKDLVNKFKYVDVDTKTLQHKKYPNVYALGDCINNTLTKTASALGPQSYVVFKNVSNAIVGKLPEATYSGYTACPIITGYDSVILTEFDYSKNPIHTFPFREDVERKSMYLLKREIMPIVYWKLLLNGLWNGSDSLRKIFHLQFDKIRE